MSKKWLVIWLTGFFLLLLVTGYMGYKFIVLKKEEKQKDHQLLKNRHRPIVIDYNRLL